MAVRPIYRLCCRALLPAVLAAMLLTAPVSAVVIVGGNGNTTAPTDDPGFANVGVSSTGGGSITYLGNGWCLTANHVTTSNSFGYLAINGKSYQITQIVTAPFSVSGADLKLFQINGDPGLSALNIASSAPPVRTTVTMIGNGLSPSSQQYWNVNVSAPVPPNGTQTWTWTPGSSGGTVNPIPSNPVVGNTYQASGFATSGNQIRWGQSLISQTNMIDFSTRDFYTTFYDPTYYPYSGPGQLPSFEAQAALGDSGGAVFYKDQVAGWKLAGIMFTVGGFPNQPDPRLNPAFGDITAIIDLSQYRSAITPVVNPFTWTGQTAGVGPTNSTWDITSTNWAGGTDVLANPNSISQFGAYRNGTSVVFGDQNAANGNSKITATAIAIQSAGVAPISVTFNNSAVNYSISISGTMGISGATGITKLGTGSVAFLGSNSFSGPVYINAGRINVQNSGALGTSAGVTVNSGAALELQGGIAIGAIPITLSGAGLAANPAGALNSVSGNNSYAGPITIGAGGATINSAEVGSTLTLSGGINNAGNPLSLSGPGNITIASLSGGGWVTAGDTLTVNPSSASTFAGTFALAGGSIPANSGGLVKSNPGTLEIDGGLSLGNNSTIQVNGGTLVVQLTSGSATIGTGVTASVASGAALQLAGSVSALSSGANSVNVANNSQVAGGGLTVNGTNQQVGAITGTGTTVINAGSDLTATSIVQNALVIGGSLGNPGRLTIQASSLSFTTTGSVSDSPLASVVADSTGASFSALDTASLSGTPLSSFAGNPSLLSGNSSSVSLNPNGATTPEPSSVVLAIVAATGIGLFGARRFRSRRARSAA